MYTERVLKPHTPNHESSSHLGEGPNIYTNLKTQKTLLSIYSATFLAPIYTQ